MCSVRGNKMKIKCEQCKEKFEFDDTYGLCPKCNYYNSLDNGNPDLDLVDETKFDIEYTKTIKTNKTTKIDTNKTTHQKVSNFIRTISLVYIVAVIVNMLSSFYAFNNNSQEPEHSVPTQQAPLLYEEPLLEEPLQEEMLKEEELQEVEEFTPTPSYVDDLEETILKCELPINLIIEDSTVIGYTTTPNLICNIAAIPEGVTQISDYAFEGCDELELLLIPSDVEYIGKYAFANLPNLKYVYILSEQLKVIDDYAFYGVKADDVFISPTVEYIGDYAMYNMNVTEFLGENTILGINAVKHEYDKSLVENDMQITNGVLVKYVGEATHLDVPEGVTQIYERAFVHSTVQTITLPESLSYIGVNAFYNSSLVEIVCPNSLTVIDDFAFDASKSLEKVGFNENLQTIGRSAFANCVKLKDLTIPKSVNSISFNSFSYTLWEEDNKPTDDKDWIVNSTILMETKSNTTETFTLPDGVRCIASFSINGHMKTPKEIVFPKGTLTISKYCVNVPNQTPIWLDIPSSVVYIDDDLIPYSELDFEMISIRCEEDSYAHRYALQHDMYFMLY